MMNRLLLIKMLREIRRGAGTYGVCVLIIAIGFCGYSMLGIASDKLTAQKQAFYRLSAFPDAMAQAHLAPLQAAKKLLAIPGVDGVQGRLIETLRVADMTGDDTVKEAELKLFSFDASMTAIPALSSGELPGPGKKELAVGDPFMKAHGLKPGDSVSLVVNGRKIAFTISAGGISPENIYLLKDISEMLPDPMAYDAGFISYETLSSLVNKQGMANSFLIFLRPGADWESIKQEIGVALEPYGFQRAFLSKDEASVAMLETELSQIGRMTTFIPFMFLSVAAVILYISLYRLVQQQRLQIGCMLSLGISPSQIRWHYMGYGAAVGFGGGTLGSFLGYLASGPLLDLFKEYFNLPQVRVPLSIKYMILGPLMATVFCGVVGWFTAYRLGNLTPAETLRPPAPKAAKRLFLESIPAFLSIMTVPGIVAVRNIARNPRRSIIVVIGISMAFMITATLISMYSLVDVFVFDSLESMQQQDISVSFQRPVDMKKAIESIRHPAVDLAEGVMEFGGIIRGVEGEITTAIQGIGAQAQLSRLFDAAGNQIFVGDSGIVLSTIISQAVGAGVGDYVEIEVSYPSKRLSKVVVTGVAAQYMGSAAYMSHEFVRKVSDYGGACTTLLIKGDQGASGDIARALKDAKLVGAISSRQETLDMFRSYMGSMTGIMSSYALTGVLISLSVLYVSSLIGFEELKREVAIMLTLGLTGRQCLDVVSVEQWILTIGGALIGYPMAIWASGVISATLSSEMYTIPEFIDSFSVVLTVAVTFGAVWVSNQLIYRKIVSVEPVELLRERE